MVDGDVDVGRAELTSTESREEVLVPVFAFDRNGRFDPTLVADDFLVFEDGVSQPITSLRRVESSVLLLLDTGGALNPAMSTNTTREIAIHLISNLRAGDRMAATLAPLFGGDPE